MLRSIVLGAFRASTIPDESSRTRNYRSLPLGREVGYLESRMCEAGPTATFWREASAP